MRSVEQQHSWGGKVSRTLLKYKAKRGTYIKWDHLRHNSSFSLVIQRWLVGLIPSHDHPAASRLTSPNLSLPQTGQMSRRLLKLSFTKTEIIQRSALAITWLMLAHMSNCQSERQQQWEEDPVYNNHKSFHHQHRWFDPLITSHPAANATCEEIHVSLLNPFKLELGCVPGCR